MQWIAQIEKAEADGVGVSFRVDWLVRRPTSAEVTQLVLAKARALITPRSYEEKRPTWLWADGNQVFALGTHPLHDQINRFHTVHQVRSIDNLIEAVRTRCEGLNPHLEDDDVDLSAPLETVRSEIGMELQIDARAVRSLLRPLRAKTSGESAILPMRFSSEEDNKIAQLIDELLLRGFMLDSALASRIFRLALLREAPLLHLSSSKCSMSVLANVGAGRLLQFNITRYVNERPSILRYVADAFDGGDIRLEVVEAFDASLEGTVLRSVRRRREQARFNDDD